MRKKVSLNRIQKHGPQDFDFDTRGFYNVSGIKQVSEKTSLQIVFEGYNKSICGKAILHAGFDSVDLFEIYDTSATEVAKRVSERLDDFRPILNI